MDGPTLAARLGAFLRQTRPRVEAAFGGRSTARRKADGSAVTDLDLALEQEIGAFLLDLDPSWGVVSEERGVLRPGTPTWHLDPVDGTANFARRSPDFVTQVALVDGAAPVFAAIYEPLQDDYTWASAGGGAWREGARLQVPATAPSDAVIYVDASDTGLFVERPTLLREIRSTFHKVRMLGSIGLHLRNVAAGIADGYLSGRGHASPVHDVAPGVLICREAGAVTSDGQGGDLLSRRDTLVIGNPPVHAALCEVLDRTST